MKMSRWVLKITEKESYRRIEPISFEHESIEGYTQNVCINLIEKNVEPKFYSRIKLTPIEAIKLGTKLICMGIESIKNQEYKPSTNEIKGFDECIFFICKILKKEIKLDNNLCPRTESISKLKSVNKDN